MANKKDSQSKQGKSGKKDDLDDLKKIIHKNELQKQILHKILEKTNQSSKSDETDNL